MCRRRARILFFFFVAGGGLLLSQTPGTESRFHIQPCRSGVDYPLDGEEAVDLEFGSLTYHLRILHPKVVPGPHISVPFFWVSAKGDKEGLEYSSLVSASPHIGGLTWDSANQGYFFGEKSVDPSEALAGFFLEGGRENSDWGAEGLLFLFEGKKSSVWRWVCSRQPDQPRGSFRITDANDETKEAPATLVQRISEVLQHAETAAEFWPGP